MSVRKFLLLCVVLMAVLCCVAFAAGARNAYQQELSVQQMEYDFIMHIAEATPESCIYWGEYRRYEGDISDSRFLFARQKYEAIKKVWQSEGIFVVTHDRENNAILICPVQGSKL